MNAACLRAEIDLEAIEHNIRVLRSFAPPGCKLCPAVKANAYGHGIRLVLPALRRAGVDMLGVATIREAQELRELAYTGPILLFGTELNAWPERERRGAAQWLVEHDVRVTVTSAAELENLTDAARIIGRPARLHFKLDSGMSRMGLYEEPLLERIRTAVRTDGLEVEGLYTHFATADDNKVFAKEQLDRFTAFAGRVRAEGIAVPLVHAANSAATIDVPGSHLDMIRPGISVYGYHTGPDMVNRPALRPALRLVTRLMLVKDLPAASRVGYGATVRTEQASRVGLVPIGYADGYNRHLSNRGQMTVAGRRVPVIGRVSMDQTVVDLTALPRGGVAVSAGDPVIVMDNDPDAPNSVESLAQMLGTIPYEITTLIGNRVERVLAPARSPEA
jgi:alanine racemase